MAKPKVTEVIFWPNGNVMAFKKNGRQVPECQTGCILDPKLIEKLNEYCDETTKFSVAVYDESLPRRYDLNLGWWFQRKEVKSDES